MLHVFLVDIGIMLKFEMELAVDSVSRLMEAVQQKVFIPANKQVLLSANGDPLNPNNRVASYASAGTETQPIYLFSKSAIESPIPPSQGVCKQGEASLKEEVERSLQMKPKYETLVARAKLAADFHRIAKDLQDECEGLLNDQILQKKGWTAVIKNLDHITSAFKSHLTHFEQLYSNFQQAQQQYYSMLQSFDQVFTMLGQLPLFDCLSGMKSDTQLTLLEWISSHDQQSSLDNLVIQCQDAIKQCKLTSLDEIILEAHKVLDFVDNANMKDIKGLSERLTSLEHRVSILQQLVQDQTDMAQGFQQNQMRAEHIGDSSVLPDLCTSHQKQLIVLLRNQHQIRDIHNLCAKAKDELSTNLHARLRWVMYVERSIYDIDSKLLVYHENLRRIKKRLDILEQVYEAPRMYVCAVLEVMRRKNFSAQFTEWCSSVSQSSIAARSEELEKRNTFKEVFNNHFVKTLFPGIDYEPPPFAEEVTDQDGDDNLPNITVEDIQLLQKRAPALMCEINLGDPLITSVIVRDTFSQSNLSKLVDPRQNKILEETLNLRERTQCDTNPLTMSVLKREICKNVPFAEETQFDVQGIKECNESHDDDVDDFHEEDFEEPSSLKSLPDNKRSTMSDDSDALFHSAELDFPGEENFGGIRTPKSNKSGSGGKSGSSPIAIKGGSTSYHKLSTRSLGYSDPSTNEKASVYSLPLIMTTDTTGTSVCSENLSPASTGSNVNARSLSEAIKTTQVIENILNAPDLVKTTKLGVSLLREQFRYIHSELLLSQRDFQMNVEEMKQRLVDVLTETRGVADCSECHLLQEKHVSENLELNKELNGLKDKYLEVISEKDRMCMEITSLEEKFVSCTDENKRLREESNASKQENEALVANLQAEILKSGNVMGQLNKQIEELNLKLQENAGNGTVINDLNEQIEELNGKLNARDQHLDDVCAERDSFVEALKKNSLEIAEKNRELSELVLGKDKLVNEYTASKEQLERLTVEFETFKLSRQQSIDGHLEQVSTSQIQLKECKRSEKENLALIKELEQKIHKLEAVISEKNVEMADKDDQLSELLQRKGSLEAQNQSNFNFVLNKIRKEKDTQINELKDKINTTEKELVSYRSKNETLLLEITVHKSAYNEIQEQLETEKDKFAQYETSLAASVAQVDTLTSELTEARDNNESLNAEKLRVIQELKVQYDEALEKEKKQLLLQFELDKESALEEFGKSDSVRAKSMSIEEGMDELELEGLVQEVKALKEENHRLKTGQSSSATCDDPSQSLISKLKSHQLVVRTIESGSLVIICLDESINQYTVLHLTTNKYFLHPDSLKVVRKILEKPGEERRWMFAYVAEIEICVCRKPQNKFNLPVNSYFTRIRINPHEMENCS